MDAAEALQISVASKQPTILQSAAVYAAIRKAAEAGKRDTTVDVDTFNVAQRESMLEELRGKGYTASMHTHQLDGCSIRITW